MLKFPPKLHMLDERDLEQRALPRRDNTDDFSPCKHTNNVIRQPVLSVDTILSMVDEIENVDVAFFWVEEVACSYVGCSE